MNSELLAKALRIHARTIEERARDPRGPEEPDTPELIRVLARIISGKTADKAFGPPGDWGYGTPIGNALAACPSSKDFLVRNALKGAYHAIVDLRAGRVENSDGLLGDVQDMLAAAMAVKNEMQ